MEDGLFHEANAAWIKQFKCKGCRNDSWGVTNQYRNSHGTFAGCCRGIVRSPCRGCRSKMLTRFIVPEDRAAACGRDRHECEACHDNGHCPILSQWPNQIKDEIVGMINDCILLCVSISFGLEDTVKWWRQSSMAALRAPQA
ncbi:hypothetical protein H257_10757 [Aphanomyces astaci]|uniref:Uncharacterized protein n=1 Tax=Aphanomyces astaci TaxID=112090 RepID=W4G4N1_APHAT|nr:hypothetical protein H257_10757 [Aphanomyces astaci]ETV74625.1 hypothetical protein H257_10757 [Aphanomyces astaci]|eukprot:XP_009835712.1 hypothetical protein H257_10757 [Aphanomyces astaci]